MWVEQWVKEGVRCVEEVFNVYGLEYEIKRSRQSESTYLYVEGKDQWDTLKIRVSTHTAWGYYNPHDIVLKKGVTSDVIRNITRKWVEEWMI